MQTPPPPRARLDSSARALARVAVAVAAGLSLSHCVAGTATTVQHIRQSSLVPVAVGPRAVGPMVPDGRFALEGSLATAATAGADGARAEGQSGQFNGTAIASVRASGSPHRSLELGLSLEYTSGYWMRPAATDLRPDDLDRRDAWRGNVGLRWLFVGDRALGFGMLAELGVASLPFRREVSSSSTFVFRDPASPPTSVSYASDASRDDHPVTVPTWQFGFFSTVRVARRVDLGGGLLAQNQPYVVGAQTATTRCEYARGQLFATSCSGADAAHTPRYQSDVLGTLFVSAAVTVGRVTFLGQLHAHALGAPETTARSRFGGTLGARVVVW